MINLNPEQTALLDLSIITQEKAMYMQDVNNWSSTDDASVTQKDKFSRLILSQNLNRGQRQLQVFLFHISYSPSKIHLSCLHSSAPTPQLLPSWPTVPTQSISYHVVKPQVILKLFPSACKTHLQSPHASQHLGQAEYGSSHTRHPSSHELVPLSQPQLHQLAEGHFRTERSLPCQM